MTAPLLRLPGVHAVAYALASTLSIPPTIHYLARITLANSDSSPRNSSLISNIHALCAQIARQIPNTSRLFNTFHTLARKYRGWPFLAFHQICCLPSLATKPLPCRLLPSLFVPEIYPKGTHTMNVKRTKTSINRTRCYHFTPAGRRCRLLVLERHALYCPRHRRAAQAAPRAHDFSELFAHGAGLFTDAPSIHRGLAMIFHALATNDISSRRAAVLTYVASQLLRTLPLLAPAQNESEEECEFIFPPRGAVGDDSEPREIIVTRDHDSASVPSSSSSFISASSGPSRVMLPGTNTSDAAGIAPSAQGAQNETPSGGFSPSDIGGPILQSAGHSASFGTEGTAHHAQGAQDNASSAKSPAAVPDGRSSTSPTQSARPSATPGVVDAAPNAQRAQEKSRTFHNSPAAVSSDATFGATGTAPGQLPPACHLRSAGLEFDRAVREAINEKRARTHNDSPLMNWPRRASFRRGSH
jgi:hypothetical protein